MESSERGADQTARLAALQAFIQAVKGDVDTAVSLLGDLNDPVRLSSALALLNQNDRFEDAVDLAQGRPVHCKWVDQAVYSCAATRRFDAAEAYVASAEKSCDQLIASRCRVFFSDAVFSELIEPSAKRTLATRPALTGEDELALRKTIDVLAPIVEQVRRRQQIDGTLEHLAVEHTARALGMLGQLSRVVDLVRPLERLRPVPLIVAQLALRRVCDPPQGLPGRLRTEHPGSFNARFLAALLDRELYSRSAEALAQLLALAEQTSPNDADESETVCQALFETAAELDEEALSKARKAIETLKGLPNAWTLFLDATSLLKRREYSGALALLEANRQESNPLWWQVLATAYERVNRPEDARVAWESACRLMPHPGIANHFAGLALEQRRFSEAATVLEQARLQHPESISILAPLAESYVRLRRYGDAAEVFESLLDLQPTEECHRFNCAICLARSGNIEKALQVLEPLQKEERPELAVLSVKCEILTSVGRAQEAFALLENAKRFYWDDQRFLMMFMRTAFSAGQDRSADDALRQLFAFQQAGLIDSQLLQPKTLDDLKELFRTRSEQKKTAQSQVLRGAIPWLFADSLSGGSSLGSWKIRTQTTKWLPDDPEMRSGFAVYATNGSAIGEDTRSGERTLVPITGSIRGTKIVADISALLTLDQLGRLEAAFRHSGNVVLPATYGEVRLSEGNSLAHGQPSQEDELRPIRSAIERNAIRVHPDGSAATALETVDEYTDDPGVYRIGDLIAALEREQRLTTIELDELRSSPLKAAGTTPLPRTSGILFDLHTLRRLSTCTWFDRLTDVLEWYISESDRNSLYDELKQHAYQRELLAEHHRLWNQIKQLSANVEWRSTDKLLTLHKEDELESSVHFDATVLADELSLPLLVDDRVCQSVIFSNATRSPDSAFGTHHLLEQMWSEGSLSISQLADDLLQLIRWRFRFIAISPEVLKCLADRAHPHLPGPELRDIASYLQQSMRDPGLFCGLEKTSSPTPLAYRHFMDWRDSCMELLCEVWKDPKYTSADAQGLTRWCLNSLLPAVPRGLIYTPIGRRLGMLTAEGCLMTAMVQFTGVQPLERATMGLRTIGDALGLSEQEFYKIAAEVADERED